MNWNLVEEAINKEIYFLKNNLSLSPYSQNDPIKCNDCLFRQMAILIVSGKISVQKVTGKIENHWPIKEKINSENEKMHGSDWHHETIKQIERYFTTNNYKTTTEPSLHFGRADLGIPELNLFVEIGTVNLYKLYINLLNMKNCNFILEPFGSYFIMISL